jgi:amino acid adenylation domain-containing protein
MLVAVAREHRDRNALWCKGRYVTYDELFSRAVSVAVRIQSQCPVASNERIAIFSEKETPAYTGILAALLAGGGYVPLNPRFPLSRNRDILIESGARVLICDEKHRSELAELLDGASSVELVLLPDSEQPAAIATGQLLAGDIPIVSLYTQTTAETRPGGLAYLFFTSGSTGKPKGVPITHANVFAYLDGIRSFCAFDSEDRVLQLFDLSFDLSVHDLFLTWMAGACLYSAPENSVLLSTRIVQEFGITGWTSVPSTAGWLKQSKQLGAGVLPSLRHSFFCGEALPGSVAQAWSEAASNSDVYNIYGPTEATVAISSYCFKSSGIPPAVVPLGFPLPGQALGLYTPEGERAEEIGEICLSGSQVMSGYWQNPELTEKRFFEADGARWYRTGDLGRFDPEEGFLYAGRADHQVKIRGYRVELQEIEHVVRDLAGADLVAVLPWAPEDGAMPKGCIAFVKDFSRSEQDVIGEARRILPEYMVPLAIVSMEELPVNTNGKIDYRALRAHPVMAEKH